MNTTCVALSLINIFLDDLERYRKASPRVRLRMDEYGDGEEDILASIEEIRKVTDPSDDLSKEAKATMARIATLHL